MMASLEGRPPCRPSVLSQLLSVDWTGGSRVLVVGLGNLLMRDDGVGVHAAQRLAADPPPGAGVVDAGTAVWHLMSLLQGVTRLLAIDAMCAGGAPGSIYVVRIDEVRASPRPFSAHSLGLPEVLRGLAPGGGPREALVLGVEPEEVGYGMELSQAVQAALPRVMDEARRIVARWQAEESEVPSRRSA